jgi:hypothetical protein
MVKTPSKQDWYTYLGEKKAQGLKSVCENSGRRGRFGGYVSTYLFSSV